MNSTEEAICDVVGRVAALEKNNETIYWVLFLIGILVVSLGGSFQELKQDSRDEYYELRCRLRDLEKGENTEDTQVKVKDD